MFVNDLQQLRHYFIRFCTDQVKVQDDLVSKFNKERRIFLDDKAKGKNNEEDLKTHIEQLEKEIQDERDYSLRVWADEQVSLLCQKSLFTYKYIQQSQENKIEGLDMR